MTDTSAHSEEPVVDKRSADIAIVCSTAAEIQPLLKKLDRVRKYTDDDATFRGGFLEESLRVAVVEAGSGFARHRKVTQTLIREHHPVWVLSVGFSSPLIDQLKPGDVCLANEICDTHGNSLAIKCPIPESGRILVRKHVVTDQHPAGAAERATLGGAYEAAAVDTTSLAVAQACQAESDQAQATKFLSIRGIIGSFTDELPNKVVSALFQPDSESAPGALGALWRKLRPDPELTSWKEAADKTARNLNKFTLGVIEQLAEKIRWSRI